MSSQVAGFTKNSYISDKSVEKAQVKSVVEWVTQQPHLPPIDETQAVLFLQNWGYDEAEAKNAIDAYFTFKTFFSGLYLGRSPFSPSMQQALDVFLLTILPQKTPEGLSVFFIKVMDPDLGKIDVPTYIKLLDMVTMLHLYREGASKGYAVLLDLASMPDGILAKLHPSLMKTLFHCMQEVTPWKLTSVHYFNTITYLTQLLNLVKPLFTVVRDQFYVHRDVEELSRYIPLECLPKDYGGSAKPTRILQEIMKTELEKNAAFFESEDRQRVIESKRLGKSEKNGCLESFSFKNWEID